MTLTPAFTIDGSLQVVSCDPQATGIPLGPACETAIWGMNVDIHIINNADTHRFVNVLMDWNQNGRWGDMTQCQGGIAVPEHVAINIPVPPGYIGPLSALNPPPFVIGRSPGYVWTRFTISEQPVPDLEWDGEGYFEDGETEDYLLQVDEPVARDYGDAPEAQTSYPTRLVNNGARHILDPAVKMGQVIDPDFDGQPNATATGDDSDPDGDDEDGLVFLTPIVPGYNAKVQIDVSVDGYIDAWMDFNKDGDWDDADENILSSAVVGAGTNVLTYYCGNLAAGTTDPMSFARFRFSRFGGLGYRGEAPEGEVEDYQVRIEDQPEFFADLGDAPDSSNHANQSMTAYPGVTAHYPTVYNDPCKPVGPIHLFPTQLAWLGPDVSQEAEADTGPDNDFVNNIIPLNDDPNHDGYDDGLVTLDLNLPHCKWSTFDYTVYNNVAAFPAPILYVNAWFDWNRDGDWDDSFSDCPDGPAPEWAVRNQVLHNLNPGLNTITSSAFLPWHPDPAEEPIEELWMRITLSEQPWPPRILPRNDEGFGGSGPPSGYEYGETEDYILVPETTCEICPDMNCDRFVDLLDVAILSAGWLDSCP